jgi:hypothetical protein
MLPNFQVATACLLCSPPDLNSSKWSHITVKITKTIFPNCSSTLIQKITIPRRRPLTQTTAFNHSNVFSVPLLLPGGGKGEAWEFSNKTMPFLPLRNKVTLTSAMTFHFHLLINQWPASEDRSHWKQYGKSPLLEAATKQRVVKKYQFFAPVLICRWCILVRVS